MKNTAYDLLSHHPALLVVVGVTVFAGAAWFATSADPRSVATVARVSLALWSVAVLIVTLSALPIGPDFHQQVNLVPGNFLGTTSRDHGGLLQSVANVAIFVPLGMLGPLAVRLTNRGVVVVGFLGSLSIEILQPALHTGRASDVNDVVLNTLGTAIGAVGFAWTVRVAQRRRRRSARRC